VIAVVKKSNQPIVERFGDIEDGVLRG